MIDMPNPKKRLLIHCEDDEIISEYSERYPFHKPSDHCLRRPEKAEIRAVDKVLNLSIKHHYPIHLVHFSSPQAALLIQQAKKEADYITCETTPHYLLLNEEVLNDRRSSLALFSTFKKETVEVFYWNFTRWDF